MAGPVCEGKDCAVFPFGRYQQDVNVKAQTPNGEKKFDFNCVVVNDPDLTALVGHNGFGFTLFSVRETKGQSPEFSSSISDINKNKEFFMKVYALIKEIFSLKKGDPRWRGDQIAIDSGGIRSDLTMSEYDNARVPQKIAIQSGGKADIVVQTTAFSATTDKDRHSH